MADGYDSRQAGRSTFAFNPSAPVQSRAASSGQSRGAGVQGGQVQGGYVPAGPLTSADINDGIPGFLAQQMKPYVERKQQEQFFEGMSKAQEGQALEEVHKSDKVLSSIFGPSSYEQGAAYYAAKQQVDKWNSAQLADVDRLKKLPPDEMAKELAETSRSMMTGNPFADQMIQKALVDATGPMMNTVTKERYKWQQQTAMENKAGAADSAATVLQQTMGAQAELTSPTDADRAAKDQALSNFGGAFIQEPDMADDTYRKFVKQSASNMLAQGNFYAFEYMRGKGLLKSGGPLDDETIAGLESKYETAKNRTYREAAMGILPDLIALDASTKVETGDPQAMIVQYAKKAAAINGKLGAITGITDPFITADDIRKGAGDVTGTLLAAYHRREARAQALADRAQDRQWKLEDEAAARAQVAAEAQAAWGGGDAAAAILGGMKKDDIDTLARNDWQQGNVKNIVRQFQLTGYGAPPVAALAQAGITASLGQGYTKDFDKTYEQWKTLNTASQGAARKYYNSHYAAMQKYDMLVKSVKPELAWVKAFGDPSQYGAAAVPPQIRRQVEEEMPNAIGKTEAWGVMGVGYLNPWAQTRLNASSNIVLTNRLRNRVAIEAANSDQPTQALVNGALQHMLADGSVERSGAFAWSNQNGNRKISDMIQAKPAEFDAVFNDVVDDRLRKDGFGEGTDGDNVTVLRLRDSNGKALFYVTATDADGNNVHDVAISSDDLKGELTKRRSAEVRGNQPVGQIAARGAARSGLNPYRRIKGETGAQRIVRINREVAAGSSPLIPGNGVSVSQAGNTGKAVKQVAHDYNELGKKAARENHGMFNVK